MNRKLMIGMVAAAFGVSTTAASCAGTTHQSAPAGATDHTPAQVIQMPSGFRNVAVKCIEVQGTWFVLASGSDGGSQDNKGPAVALVADPKCSHYGP